MIHLSSLLLVQACPWTSGPDLLQHPLHQDVVQVILRVTTSIHASIVIPAFDPDYDSAPLEFFAPMVMRLFEKPLNSIYKRIAA